MPTTPPSPPISTDGSMLPSIKVAAVVTHATASTVAPAIERLEEVARVAGVELVFDEQAAAGADIAVVLGGDGTML